FNGSTARGLWYRSRPLHAGPGCIGPSMGPQPEGCGIGHDHFPFRVTRTAFNGSTARGLWYRRVETMLPTVMLFLQWVHSPRAVVSGIAKSRTPRLCGSFNGSTARGLWYRLDARDAQDALLRLQWVHSPRAVVSPAFE